MKKLIALVREDVGRLDVAERLFGALVLGALGLSRAGYVPTGPLDFALMWWGASGFAFGTLSLIGKRPADVA